MRIQVPAGSGYLLLTWMDRLLTRCNFPFMEPLPRFAAQWEGNSKIQSSFLPSHTLDGGTNAKTRKGVSTSRKGVKGRLHANDRSALIFAE